MSRKLDHTVTFDAPAATVYATFSDESYWQQLATTYLEVVPQSEITEFSCSASGIDVELRQVMAAAELPAIIRAVIPLDLTITRRQHFEPFDLGRNSARGSFTASAAHLPFRLDVKSVLGATSTGSRMQLASSCKVNLPLIGGKIEALVLQGIRELFSSEEAFTADWIAKQS